MILQGTSSSKRILFVAFALFLTLGLPALLNWAARVPLLLLFGGEGLGEKLELEGTRFETVRVPESERRFLFVVRR